ncbi:MAG TPA: 4-hydroxy-tetrahydrodipicolinate synthase [Elusimicrobia bacterium]|nr:MAG: 4-hydroxy-tetrahydrodipicolinate synthase [Elusimicrobia bacterium RIFOXYA12_FULL_49_49]OGS09222.1 MAG: 4-hydroxy-tetrahydrodipicolinate synthase [Elusimicrobia bacterium RIFOXYA1_FULL_47_7]OGS10026.1 MAG: 4-hydroxy-tetrahydrodipicolinate synthase [Elusimicrobia bacterium RIFOXYB1_FULL_48_9]OGS16207.1 MAG: 4-hydroxy-tetrahydrodipicolinate synthase [Elusimicrobia bacterium RIFOXYA2_FULL_47_53]OGS26594.1 MAG: 4-hydroxy-tetrahydrodipicolinate synthase [Elusimicrobia bacterium RIFOXYB12_FUL
MFSGSIVALVTPFKNNKIDADKLRELVEFHVENGTSGIVPCGTTGESATLSYEEHEEVISLTVKFAAKRVKVIAGTGSNNTAEAIMLTQFAEKAGCDGALLIAPYYNKPTQKGLYMHFSEVAKSVKIPIILYNIQSRTAVNMEPETIAKIAKDHKNVVAVKEASGSLDQMSQVKALAPEIDLLSGDDALTLPVLSIGGSGVISVVANIVPKDTSDMVAAWLSGDHKKALKLHYKLLPLVKAMFVETNPIPVKTAMSLMGLCGAELRLPLTQIEDANKLKLEKAMRNYGLIS